MIVINIFGLPVGLFHKEWVKDYFRPAQVKESLHFFSCGATSEKDADEESLERFYFEHNFYTYENEFQNCLPPYLQDKQYINCNCIYFILSTTCFLYIYPTILLIMCAVFLFRVCNSML